jgi:plastocyanin
MKLLLLIAVVVAFGVVVVAQAAERPRAQAARTVEVSVRDASFKPRRLSVPSGTRVHWLWRGSLVHNVTVASGPRRFHSKDQSSGEFARTLRKRGAYKLVCTLHGFRMRIDVHKP